MLEQCWKAHWAKITLDASKLFLLGSEIKLESRRFGFCNRVYLCLSQNFWHPFEYSDMCGTYLLAPAALTRTTNDCSRHSASQLFILLSHLLPCYIADPRNWALRAWERMEYLSQTVAACVSENALVVTHAPFPTFTRVAEVTPQRLAQAPLPSVSTQLFL